MTKRNDPENEVEPSRKAKRKKARTKPVELDKLSDESLNIVAVAAALREIEAHTEANLITVDTVTELIDCITELSTNAVVTETVGGSTDSLPCSERVSVTIDRLCQLTDKIVGKLSDKVDALK